jgi:hypothetical protein
MGEYRVAAAFREGLLVEAETAEEAEEKTRRLYSTNAIELAGRLRISAEDCSDTSEAAYQGLLAKTRCSSDYCRSVTLAGLSADARVDFLAAQLDYLGVKGYTREQVERLVRENLRRLYGD